DCWEISRKPSPTSPSSLPRSFWKRRNNPRPQMTLITGIGYFLSFPNSTLGTPPIRHYRETKFILIVADLAEGRASARPGRAEARPSGMRTARPSLQINRLCLDKLSDEIF